MNFEDALKTNGLGSIIEAQYGRWGEFTKDAADLIVKVSMAEDVPASLLSVTWMNESIFAFNPKPNTNKQPTRPEAWDVGPFQLNVLWTYKSVWVREFRPDPLHFDAVFGKEFFIIGPDDVRTPAPFTGDPLANARMAARKLFSIKGDWEAKAVKFTGGDEARQKHRSSDWKKYSPLFSEFFQKYTSD